jgi:hypothetical protein
MFSRSTFFVAFTALAAAVSAADSQCNTGAIQCCNQVQEVNKANSSVSLE